MVELQLQLYVRCASFERSRLYFRTKVEVASKLPDSNVVVFAALGFCINVQGLGPLGFRSGGLRVTGFDLRFGVSGFRCCLKGMTRLYVRLYIREKLLVGGCEDGVFRRGA